MVSSEKVCSLFSVSHCRLIQSSRRSTILASCLHPFKQAVRQRLAHLICGCNIAKFEKSFYWKIAPEG